MRRCTVVAVFVSIAFVLPAWSAEFAGRVYFDANGNGRFDPGEKPVAQCLVSDGAKLARSDASGLYRLEVPDGLATVFLVNPPGTWPAGPWWVTDSDSGRQTADFALAELAQDEPLVFVQGTDLHVKPSVEELYQRYVRHVNALPLPVRFVVHTGDLVVDSLRSTPAEAEPLFELYERGAKAIRVPVREVIGNHEHVGLARHDGTERLPDGAKGMFLRRIGPTNYAFRWGRYHFVALDCTTLNPEAKNGYYDQLNPAAVAWAAAYLATLSPGEPVILMTHQPLTGGPAEKQLLAALEAKRLLLTIWGHGHGRPVKQWGGAPAVMGGAVSYAWHGFLPYPPDPWGYVVYRLEGDRVEYAFCDWAAERSFDLREPAWGKIVSGTQAIAGTVTDFDGSIARLTCRLADRQAEARLSRPGHLVQEFQAELDGTGLDDGVYDLVLTAEDGRKKREHSRPVIVKNGRSVPFAAAVPAVLRMKVAGAAPREILVDGKPLAAPRRDKEGMLSLTLPPDRLTRLCEVAVRPAADSQFSQVRIELDGQCRRDVRIPPNRKIAPLQKETVPPAQVYYIDLTYDGPRGR